MSTVTETAPVQAPEITILKRVTAIPMISSSLESIDNTLSSNAYTKSSYETAKDLSTSAIKYTEPIQIRLAPLITKADGLANQAVDAVGTRYEGVSTYVNGKRVEATQYVTEVRNTAGKTLDERVKAPLASAAAGIDQRFAPIVDYYEVAVNRVSPEANSEAGPSSPDAQYQYQRAYALSVNLKDSLYGYSAEQIKQLQAQSVLIQRATTTAQSITSLASSSIANTQARIHTLSESMLAELQKLQQTASSLPSAALSSSYAQELGSAVTDLRAILADKETTVNQKATKVAEEVKERVNPMLEGVQKRLGEVVGAFRAGAEQGAQEAKANGSGKQ